MARKQQSFTVVRLHKGDRTDVVTGWFLDKTSMTRDELEAWISGDDFDSGALVFVGDAIPVKPVTTAQIGAVKTRKRTPKAETAVKPKRARKNGAVLTDIRTGEKAEIGQS